MRAEPVQRCACRCGISLHLRGVSTVSARGVGAARADILAGPFICLTRVSLAKQGQGLADVARGMEFPLSVEADVGGLAGADDAHEFGLEGMGGEREQAGLLVGPDLGDGTVGLLGVAPLVGDVVSPASKLGVEVVEVAEGPGGKKAWRRYWICRSIFSLLISASRCAGSGGEVVVAGELEQAGVELDGGAAAVEDGASEVVVDERAGGPAQRRRLRRVRGGSSRGSGRG